MKKWIKACATTKSLGKVIQNLPREKVIVYTYGAWDILHPGHIKLLINARELGDYLIVGVVDDGAIKKLKGEGRPIQCAKERLFNVSSLRCVDAAIIQKGYDPSPELLILNRVDILTKGNDWRNIPGEKTVLKMGGKLIKLNYSNGYSTSKLISRISGRPLAKHGEPKC